MILLILILSFCIRFINLSQSLWFDEAINIVYAKSSTFWWFMTRYSVGDFHPPGYFAILWVWGHIFGFSEISTRLPSVIFGVLTIFFTYLTGVKLFSKKIALIASLFLALSPLHIYYSQDARMYSFAAFAVVISSYFLLKFLLGEKNGLCGYALSVALILYADYLPYFVLPAHIIFVFFYHKNLIKKYILAAFAGFSTIIPWLFIFPTQLETGIDKSAILKGWTNVVGGVGYKEAILLPVKILVGRIDFENMQLYVFFVLLALVPVILALYKVFTNLNEKVNFLLMVVFIPAIIAFVFSFFIPVFSYFRLLFIVPAFYLILSYGFEKYSKRVNIFLIAFMLFFEMVASGIYLFNPNFHREDWKGSVGFINKNANKDTLVLHKNSEIPAPFTYYQSGSINTIPAFDKIPVRSDEDLANLENKLAKFNKIFLFNYLTDVTDPDNILEKKLLKIGFKKIKTYNFRGVGFLYLYAR